MVLRTDSCLSQVKDAGEKKKLAVDTFQKFFLIFILAKTQITHNSPNYADACIGALQARDIVKD